ncbi:MAG: biotin/lipoyl-binding protein [Candidatus Velthaea sp.]|jgi:acetyl-CoA carboxylase biotin carboxyl carrier protein
MFDETIASRIRPLAEVFRAVGLVRLTVREADFEVEFRRTRSDSGAGVEAPDPEPGEAPALSGAGPLAVAGHEPDLLASDVVGIVRLMRPPVVEGQYLDGDRDLAFVETLGIRNPVRSRGSGTVSAVFVTDGQPVEYGQPLFAIER